MSRGPTLPLPKGEQVLYAQVVSGKVKQAVEQHAAVPGRQDEAIALRPARVERIVAQMALPEDVGHGRRTHGHPRMARVGLLDCIDGQSADRVNA